MSDEKTQIPQLKFSNGMKIPMLGLGTWQLNGSTCISGVKAALGMGYNHIDTAEMYGNENEVRQGMQGFDRKSIFITSKVWPESLSYQHVIDACDNSLKRLGTGYLDLYLLHWPVHGADYKEVFRAFRKLVDDGKAKSVGVSNFTIHHLHDTLPIAKELGLQIAANEVEFHPGLYQKELLEFCSRNGIALIAYSPLGRGKVAGEKSLLEIAKKHGKTAFQVSLRWILQHGVVVIPKASSEKHLADNMGIFDFELSAEEMKAIDAMGGGDRIVVPAIAEFDY